MVTVKETGNCPIGICQPLDTLFCGCGDPDGVAEEQNGRPKGKRAERAELAWPDRNWYECDCGCGDLVGVKPGEGAATAVRARSNFADGTVFVGYFDHRGWETGRPNLLEQR